MVRFNPPPNWPTPPAGWSPPPGWEPDQRWGPAPSGWQVWVSDAQPDGLIATIGTRPPQREADPDPTLAATKASLSSPAWRSEFGPRITAGQLTLHQGRLRFDSAAGSAFDVPVTTLSGLRISPFGSQLSFKVDGHKYRITFAQPGLAGGVSATRSIIGSRRAMKAWREALGV